MIAFKRTPIHIGGNSGNHKNSKLRHAGNLKAKIGDINIKCFVNENVLSTCLKNASLLDFSFLSAKHVRRTR